MPIAKYEGTVFLPNIMEERKMEEDELHVFYHDHPLFLRERTDVDGGRVYCYGCRQPISGMSYGCTRCHFFLHKSCAQLPLEITHPSHPLHPLSFLPNPPHSAHQCGVCREDHLRFVYRCSPCDFDVDIKCAWMSLCIQKRMEHPSHQHPLILLQKPAMFLCDACGTEKHRGTSYLCTTCGFWVHQKCSSLPTTVNLSDHHHSLTLIYSIPFEYYKSRINCGICSQRIYKSNWVYCCSEFECRYFVHLNCGATKTEDCKIDAELQHLVFNMIELDSSVPGIETSIADLSKYSEIEIKVEDLHPNLITLPADESIDLTTQFIRNISIQGKYKGAIEIKHVSNDHPLIFYDKQIHLEPSSSSSSSSSESKLPLLNKVKNDEKCNGCAQTISASFYHCAQCKFFLHEWCAELPDKLQHPCHPKHPLLLTTNLHLSYCRCCREYCDGFKFGCSDCEFYLDSKCASLPRIISHEAHEHTLALRVTPSMRCNNCGYIIEFGFVCDRCNFSLCIRCVLLPGKVRHRYDKHLFTLTYSLPLKEEQVDEYFCEICEGDIDSDSDSNSNSKTKYWIYHRDTCDQSLHTQCIRPVDKYSNIKVGITVNLEDHPHLLSLVAKYLRLKCHFCGFIYSKDMLFLPYECATCNFSVCHFCVQKYLNKKEI